MKQEKFNFKVMLADQGGMTISDEGRTAYASNDDLALDMGKWILESMDANASMDARVTVTIDMED